MVCSERIPLLSRGVASQYSYADQPTSQILVGSSSLHYANGAVHSHLSELGWVQYNLPDGTTYYSHLTRKVTTDLDLRSERILRAVTIWVEERENETVSVEVEGWLLESKDTAARAKKKSGWGRQNKKEEEPIYLERWWVDHHHRSVTKGIGGAGEHVGYSRSHAYTNGYGNDNGKGKKQAKHAKHANEDRKSFSCEKIFDQLFFPQTSIWNIVTGHSWSLILPISLFLNEPKQKRSMC